MNLRQLRLPALQRLLTRRMPVLLSLQLRKSSRLSALQRGASQRTFAGPLKRAHLLQSQKLPLRGKRRLKSAALVAPNLRAQRLLSPQRALLRMLKRQLSAIARPRKRVCRACCPKHWPCVVKLRI